MTVRTIARRIAWRATAIITVGLGIVLVPGSPAPAAAQAVQPLDFEYYKENIEPIFTRPRGGFAPGDATCVMCHTWQTNIRFKLQDLQERPNGGVFWSEEQSRQNFEVVRQLVRPGDPNNSRLLLKPLARAAGGLAHTGGDFWASKDDPEARSVAEWVSAATPVAIAPEPNVDFEFFRSCVQRIFISPIPGAIGCIECHSGSGITSFAGEIGGGRNYWNEEESRRNYETAMRLVIPGNPDGSRFLLKALAPEAGGEYVHNGGRRWESKSDPEWQMLAAWVRGERTGSTCRI